MKPTIQYPPPTESLLDIECGEDVWIAASAYIRYPSLARLGNHVAIDHLFYCTTQLEIDDYVHIAPNAIVIGGDKTGLIMGHFAEVSPRVTFICGSDEWLGEGLVSPLIPLKYRDNLKVVPITLEPFSGVGTCSTILPGVTLRQGAVLGNNSFAREDLEEWTIYAGNPARPIKKRRKDKMLAYAKEMGYEF